jgi:flagellar basal-body rod protein FlgG
MINSLYIGATGMQAQQVNVDAIANNLANVNTTGFKKSRVSFEDLVYRQLTPAQYTNEADASSVAMGLGSFVSSNAKSFLPGEVKQTESPLDFAIRGSGFFEVVLPDGSSAYTRHGEFRVTSDGLLGTQSGYPLKQQIQIPAEALEVVVDASGKVSARMSNETTLTELGQLELSSFTNPQGLDPIGENLYTAGQTAGQPRVSKPGEDGTGSIAQGFLESSNVKLAEEMVNLVLAQRAYELNAKIIQTSDEMLAVSNNLRR